MEADRKNGVMIGGKLFGALTPTGYDFPWMWGEFRAGPDFARFERFIVVHDEMPEAETLDFYALARAGVASDQVQWGPPDEHGPTYLHCLDLRKGRTEASWRFGPAPIELTDD